MATAEKFCLRWNDFEANISSAFRELRDDKDFFDVTLACDDEQISAHKVILSACSPFFRTVLRRNRHDHPLLYLRGVKYVDLVAVLNFMYHGEVNVAQEELNSFLAVAEDLKVKGLTQNGSDKKGSAEPPPTKMRDPPDLSNSPAPPPPKRPRPAPPQIQPAPKPTPQYHDEDDDIQEVVPVKSEPVSQGQDHFLNNTSSPVTHSESHVTDDYGPGQGGIVADPNIDPSGMYGVEDYVDYGNYEEGDTSMLGGAATADGNKELDEMIAKSMEKVMTDDGMNYVWQCLQCGKCNKDKSIVKHHVETHFPGYTHQCHICQNFMKTRKSLKMHMIREHSGRKDFVIAQ